MTQNRSKGRIAGLWLFCKLSLPLFMLFVPSLALSLTAQPDPIEYRVDNHKRGFTLVFSPFDVGAGAQLRLSFRRDERFHLGGITLAGEECSSQLTASVYEAEKDGYAYRYFPGIKAASGGAVIDVRFTGKQQGKFVYLASVSGTDITLRLPRKISRVYVDSPGLRPLDVSGLTLKD